MSDEVILGAMERNGTEVLRIPWNGTERRSVPPFQWNGGGTEVILGAMERNGTEVFWEPWNGTAQNVASVQRPDLT